MVYRLIWAVVLLLLASCSSSSSNDPDDGNGGDLARPEGILADSAVGGGRPFGVATTSSGTVLFTLLDEASIVRGSATNPGAGFNLIDVGSVPTDVDVSATGARAFVTNQADGTVGIVDVLTGAQVNTVAVTGSPFRVRQRPGSQLVYATTNAGFIFAINPATSAVVDSLLLPSPDVNGLAFHPTQARAYASSMTGPVYEVELATLTVLRTFNLTGVSQDLVVSLDGSELYLADESGRLVVINLASGDFTPHATAGLFGLALTVDGTQLYATAPGLNKILVFDRATRVTVDTIVTGAVPRRVAFTTDGMRAVVTAEEGRLYYIR